MREKIVLSDRLMAAASMVTRGNRVCDVGCDHAFVPVYLVGKGISPYVIAMDVRKGPLGQARENIKEYGLEPYIDTRISDGLENYKIQEADSLICAGMGGKLMMNILGKYPDKTASFKELILQPQSEIQQFRQFLRYQGYMVTEENMIEEGGKFYTIIKARAGSDSADAADNECNAGKRGINSNAEKTLTLGDSLKKDWLQQMYDRYGAYLIRNRHPVLGGYIKWELGIYEEILAALRAQDMSKPNLAKRYKEVEEKLNDARAVLDLIL